MHTEPNRAPAAEGRVQYRPPPDLDDARRRLAELLGPDSPPAPPFDPARGDRWPPAQLCGGGANRGRVAAIYKAPAETWPCWGWSDSSTPTRPARLATVQPIAPSGRRGTPGGGRPHKDGKQSSQAKETGTPAGGRSPTILATAEPTADAASGRPISLSGRFWQAGEILSRGSPG